jgi:mannose-6-phosphate isomerase
MGTHPLGPSEVEAGSISVPLQNYAGKLPFLFKVIAAEKPLSIQAHPTKEEAEAGFAAENAAGIKLTSPERNYKDPNAKKEVLCALSPFTAMAGFRPINEIITNLDALGCAVLLPLREALTKKKNDASLSPPANDEVEAYRGFLEALFGLNDGARGALDLYLALNRERFLRSAQPELRLVAKLATLFPRDPTAISPLYLNLVHLESGEALFIPEGMLHSYVEGLGVELMTASDNVLRGGITNKHIDKEQLLKILKAEVSYPEKLLPAGLTGASILEGFAVYPVPASDWFLSVQRGQEASGALSFPVSGNTIIFVAEGSVRVKYGGETLECKRGESAFIPRSTDRNNLSMEGTFTLYAASEASQSEVASPGETAERPDATASRDENPC